MVVFLDIIAFCSAVYLGFALRFTLFLPDAYWEDFLRTSALFSTCVIFTLFCCGNYRVLWVQSSIDDYTAYIRQYLTGALVFILVIMLYPVAFLPRSTLVILILAGLVFGGALRGSWRAFTPERLEKKGGKRTIIVGAGEAGVLLVKDLLSKPGELWPIGFVDDSDEKINRSIVGLPVLGSCSELPSVVKEYDIKTVLIAMPSATGKRIREIFDMTVHLGVSVCSLPSLREIAGGHVGVSRLRDIQLEDLLGRETIEIDTGGIKAMVSGKTILITGAGGSIGSEIVTQLLDMRPERLLVLGHGEQSIYKLLERIKNSTKIPLIPIIADVAERKVMSNVFKKWKPQLIFHAAAHKHVPLMQENPLEAVRVNSFGTYNLAMLAGEHGTERMVMISTDKAVNPTSIMGATKRIAELVLNEVQQKYPSTLYMAVRFGNVLGSRGSVVPKFRDQIAEGNPITITHPDMKRYFMLISEAVSLVLQAGTIGKGGELFVLDMGEPIRIADMADMLIRLHGLVPGQDIRIEYTGIREGEKLFEELFYDPEHVERTVHPKIFLSHLTPSFGVSEQICRAVSEGEESIVSLISKLVPEYKNAE